MASLLHREAIVIHTWTLPAVEIVPPSFIAADEAAAIASDQQRIASEFLAGWRTEFPDVKVTMRVIQGNTAAVLLEAAKTASLVVTGSRGRGEFRGAFLGSTSNALIHHAGCPVAIVRTEKPVVVKSQAAAA
ncbi:MAG: universal stress protein [Actinomycetes bacterium]